MGFIKVDKVFEKFKNVKVVVRLKIPAGQAKAQGGLSPILGQYGVNINDFCTKFNQSSKIFCEGLIVVVYLKIYTDKTFDIQITGPSTAYCFEMYKREKEKKALTFLSLYKIFLIKKKVLFYNDRSLVSMLYGSLKSKKFNLIDE